MEREPLKKVLEKVLEGHLHLVSPRALSQESYVESLGYYALNGEIDFEEANIAMIQGTKKLARMVLEKIGLKQERCRLGKYKTYLEFLDELTNRGFISEEEFLDAQMGFSF